MLERDPALPIEEFDAHFSPELKKLVHETEACQRYLFERQRISKLAADHVAKGGALSDCELEDGVRLLAELAAELSMAIQACKDKLKQ